MHDVWNVLREIGENFPVFETPMLMDFSESQAIFNLFNSTAMSAPTLALFFMSAMSEIRLGKKLWQLAPLVSF